MRTTAALAWLTTTATLATALVLWPTLPDRLPMHFDASGRPDGYADRALPTWLLLPGVATAITVLFAEVLPRWTAAMARNGSRWLNVPQRERFLALPPDARVHVLRPLHQALALAAMWCNLMFLYIVVGIHRVALGANDHLPAWPAMLVVAAIVVTVLHAAVRCDRAIRRAAAPPPIADGA